MSKLVDEIREEIARYQHDIMRQTIQAQLFGQVNPSPPIRPGQIRLPPSGGWGLVDKATYEKRQRILEKRRNLRAADGALIGYRYWKLAPKDDDEDIRDYFLVSPTQHTVWHGPVLEAHEFSESSMCEGYAGVHARYKRDEESPYRLLERKPKVTSSIWGRVRGYGAFVRGSDGWRAQRVMVDKLWLPSILNLTNGVTVIPNLMKSWGIDLADRLATRYECRVVTPLEKPIINFNPEEYDL